jgi:hypothetical protein
MNPLATMNCAVRVALLSLKAAWLHWNDLQAAAADTLFQRRIDPSSGRTAGVINKKYGS